MDGNVEVGLFTCSQCLYVVDDLISLENVIDVYVHWTGRQTHVINLSL